MSLCNCKPVFFYFQIGRIKIHLTSLCLSELISCNNLFIVKVSVIHWFGTTQYIMLFLFPHCFSYIFWHFPKCQKIYFYLHDMNIRIAMECIGRLIILRLTSSAKEKNRRKTRKREKSHQEKQEEEKRIARIEKKLAIIWLKRYTFGQNG